MIKEKLLSLLYGATLIIDRKQAQRTLFNSLTDSRSPIYGKNYALRVACKLNQPEKFLEHVKQSSSLTEEQTKYLEAMALRKMKQFKESWEVLKSVPSTNRSIMLLKVKNLYDMRDIEGLIDLGEEVPVNNLLTTEQKQTIFKYAYEHQGILKTRKLSAVLFGENADEKYDELKHSVLQNKYLNRDLEQFKQLVKEDLFDISSVETKKIWFQTEDVEQLPSQIQEERKKLIREFLDMIIKLDGMKQKKYGLKLIKAIWNEPDGFSIPEARHYQSLVKVLKGKHKFDSLYLKWCILEKRQSDCFRYVDVFSNSKKQKLFNYLSKVSYEKKRLKLALDFAQRAYELNNQNHMTLRNLVRTNHRLGNITDRFRYIEKLKETAPHRLLKNEYENALDECHFSQKNWTWTANQKPIYHPDGPILHVLNKSAPAVNGYTIRSTELIEQQKNNGLKPVVVTKFGWSPEQQEENIYKVNRNGIDHYHLVDTETNIMLNQSPMSMYFTKYADEFAKLVRKLKPAVIHAASNFQNALPPLAVAKAYGIPSVYEVRGLWHYTQSTKTPGFEGSERYHFHEKYELLCCQIADKVVCISESLKKHLVAMGIDESKIELVTNGVNPEKFTPQPPSEEVIEAYDLKDKFVIGFIGSITAYEGIDYLLYALKSIKASGKLDTRLLLVGDGPELENLKQLAGELHIQDMVHFIGRVPPAEVGKYYSVVDVFPFPRINAKVCELVTPLKPYEAMAMGKTVAVSDIPALQEMIKDKKTGLVFQAESAQALTECLLSIPQYKHLAEAGRSWVLENKSWIKLGRKYNEIYEDLLHDLTAQPLKDVNSKTS